MMDWYQLQRLTRAATDLGHYNLAKLLTAAAASINTRALSTAELPKTDRALLDAAADVYADLLASNVDPELARLVQHALDQIRSNGLVLYHDAPPLYVCRVCGQVTLNVAPAHCPQCGAGELVFQAVPATFYLEPLPVHDVLAELARTPDWLAATLRDLPPDQLTRSIAGVEGAWSLSEAAGHLLDTQELIAQRVQLFMTHEAPDLNARNMWQAVEATGLTAADLIERFRRSREAMLDTLRAAPPDYWQRVGQHTEFGPVTLLQQCSYFAKHEHWHMAQMTRIRQSLA